MYPLQSKRTISNDSKVCTSPQDGSSSGTQWWVPLEILEYDVFLPTSTSVLLISSGSAWIMSTHQWESAISRPHFCHGHILTSDSFWSYSRSCYFCASFSSEKKCVCVWGGATTPDACINLKGGQAIQGVKGGYFNTFMSYQCSGLSMLLHCAKGYLITFLSCHSPLMFWAFVVRTVNTPGGFFGLKLSGSLHTRLPERKLP